VIILSAGAIALRLKTLKKRIMKMFSRTFLLFLLFLSVAGFAQTPQRNAAQGAAAQSADCFKEWYTLFRERGASTVSDGTHDVIITLRNTMAGTSTCYMGKAEVAGGRLKRPLMIQLADGSYETFAALGKGLDPVFAKSRTEEELSAITDGMSINFTMSDAEFGRIFFYTFLNDKPKALKQAPSPKALIKK